MCSAKVGHALSHSLRATLRPLTKPYVVGNSLPGGAARALLPSHRRLNSDNDKHNTRSCGHSRTSCHCLLSLCSSHAHKEHPRYPPRRTRHTQGFTGERGRMSTLAPTLSSHFLSYHLPQTSAPARSQGILHHARCLVLISRYAVYSPSP